MVAGEESSIESIDEGVIDEKVLGENAEDCGGFREDEENGGQDGEGAVEDGEECRLGDVGQCEHGNRDAKAEREGW